MEVLFFVWLVIQTTQSALTDTINPSISYCLLKRNCGQLQPKLLIENLNATIIWEKSASNALYYVEYADYLDSINRWKVLEACNITSGTQCNLGNKLDPPDTYWCVRILQILNQKTQESNSCDCTCFNPTHYINENSGISYYAGVPENVKAIFQSDQNSIKVTWDSPKTVYGNSAESFLDESYCVRWKWSNQSEQSNITQKKSVVLTEEDSILPNTEYNITVQIVINKNIWGSETEPITIYSGELVKPSDLKPTNISPNRINSSLTQWVNDLKSSTIAPNSGHYLINFSLAQWIKILALFLGVTLLILIIWLLKKTTKEIKKVPYPCKEMIKSLYHNPSHISYELNEETFDQVDANDRRSYNEAETIKSINNLPLFLQGSEDIEMIPKTRRASDTIEDLIELNGLQMAERIKPEPKAERESNTSEDLTELSGLLKAERMQSESLESSDEDTTGDSENSQQTRLLLVSNEPEYRKLADIIQGRAEHSGFADTQIMHETTKEKIGVNLNYNRTIDRGQSNINNERETSL